MVRVARFVGVEAAIELVMRESGDGEGGGGGCVGAAGGADEYHGGRFELSIDERERVCAKVQLIRAIMRIC